MKYLFSSFLFFVLLTPVLVFAQYQPLVGIPGVSDTQNFDEYLQAVYATAISLAALLAVIKIVIAGVKWMTTDIVTSKSDAKKDIQGAIFGLLVILGAVLILYIINPNIGTVNLSITPAPIATGGTSSIETTAITDCKSRDDCTFQEMSCVNVYYIDEVRANVQNAEEYNCDPLEAACLGDFVESADGKFAACLTSDAIAAAALTDIANANCPTGDTCTANICTNLIFNCEKSCLNDGGVHYDSDKKVCVKGTQTGG